MLIWSQAPSPLGNKGKLETSVLFHLLTGWPNEIRNQHHSVISQLSDQTLVPVAIMLPENLIAKSIGVIFDEEMEKDYGPMAWHSWLSGPNGKVLHF